MADHQSPSELTAESRRFLEELLEDCRRDNFPNQRDLIRLIEEALAGKRPPHEPGA